MRKIMMFSAVLALAIFCACPMFADTCNGVSANLVSNCGFETGDLSGWTVGGNTANPGENYYGVDNFDAHSGNFGAYMSEDAIDGGTGPVTLSQVLGTQPGETYQISFWLQQDSAVDGTTVHSFNASFDGSTLLALNPTTSSPGIVGTWTEYTFLVEGEGLTSNLGFSFRNDDNYWSFDDVSVLQTPEPPPSLLVGTALIALIGLRRITAN